MFTYIKELKNRSEEGFTLTELIVVIVIIGVLVAISVTVSSKNKEQALALSMKTELTNIAMKVSQDINENNGKLMPKEYTDELKSYIASNVKDPNVTIGVEVKGYNANMFCLSAFSKNDYNKNKKYYIMLPNATKIYEANNRSIDCDSLELSLK